MTVLAAGASAASVALAQPMPPRRPPMERVESPKQPPARTPEAQSEKLPTRSSTRSTAHRRCRVLGEAACRRLGRRARDACGWQKRMLRARTRSREAASCAG